MCTLLIVYGKLLYIGGYVCSVNDQLWLVFVLCLSYRLLERRCSIVVFACRTFQYSSEGRDVFGMFY